MPTKREREYYAAGYRDGRKDALRGRGDLGRGAMADYAEDYQIMLGEADSPREVRRVQALMRRKPKRKLSPWNKFVKANSKKPRFRYKNGKLNLKKMGVAFRKTPAGRKKKRNRSY